MRGQHVSKPVESIIAEAKHLAAQGVKEIMLIAQELTYYGLDIYKKRMLPDLLRKLSEVEGIEWIRLHYAYPNKFPLEILDAMNESEKICKYLDIPLQHISNNVLSGMKRQITLYMPSCIPAIHSRNVCAAWTICRTWAMKSAAAL